MQISGYRNLKPASLTFGSNVNFIYGKNAQGKTNLIEAIWMFTGARSFRGTKDVDLVNFNESSAKLRGRFLLEQRSQEIAVFFSGGKRKVFLNGVAKPYPTSVIGKFRVVLFSPIQLSLVTGGPEGRRKFLDAAICQLKPTFLSKVAQYNKVLKQRNALLKDMTLQQSFELLDVWDENLARLGSEIVKERLDYLEFLKQEAFKIYSEISGLAETLKINYISSFEKKIAPEISTSEIYTQLKTKLEKSRNSDVKSGFTNFGAHKDELDFLINDKKVKFFGSQGQQRSVALSLKLAEAAGAEKFIGEPPVILLDDVMSELDDYRKNYMIEKITGKQVFITNCDASVYEKFENGKLFEVENGVIKEF